MVSLLAKKLVEKLWLTTPIGEVVSVLIVVPIPIGVGVTRLADLKCTSDPPLYALTGGIRLLVLEIRWYIFSPDLIFSSVSIHLWLSASISACIFLSISCYCLLICLSFLSIFLVCIRLWLTPLLTFLVLMLFCLLLMHSICLSKLSESSSR